jgi:nucleoside-diphosphate-sugar epimerase
MDPSPAISDGKSRRLCVVTGGRGFVARHLVTALLRSGDWRVRITDLGPEAALSPAEKDGLLGAALHDGRAAYVSVDVCELAQLTKGTTSYYIYSIIRGTRKEYFFIYFFFFNSNLTFFVS